MGNNNRTVKTEDKPELSKKQITGELEISKFFDLRNTYKVLLIVLCIFLCYVLLITKTSCSLIDQNETLDLIVYIEDHNVSIMETSGRKIKNVVVSDTDDYVFISPKWNPLGDKIAYVGYHNQAPLSVKIDVVEFSPDLISYYDPLLDISDEQMISTILKSQPGNFTFELVDLTRFGVGSCDFYEVAFDWLSDETLVLLCQEDEDQQKVITFCEIPIVEGVENLTATCESLPHPNEKNLFSSLDYSPVNNKILLSSDKFGEVYLYDPISFTFEHLFDGENAVWSSKGEKIAYGKEFDLYMYDVLTREHTLIYESEGITSTYVDASREEFLAEYHKTILVNHHGIAWGKDDKELYFTATRYSSINRPSIYRIDLETLEIFTLTVDESLFADFHSFPIP